MSSTNETVALIASLNYSSDFLNRYLSILIYIFGLIGNFLNVLVLSQRSLRCNPSAVFFLLSSIAGIIVILSGLTSRMLSGYAVDLTLTIEWICKLRNVLLYSARTFTLWMIGLATVDRWLSSSIHAHLRQQSSMKNVWRSVSIVLLYTCFLNAPNLYCYQANLTGALRGCYTSTYSCTVSTNLLYAFGTVLFPLMLMIIFGLLTIRNVHHIQTRVHTRNQTGTVLSGRNTNTSINTRRKDRQLLKMLLVQVILLFLFTSPHAIQKVYSSFASSPPSQSVQSAIQTLIFNLFTLLTFIASVMPFYIYTLSGGSVFRNALFDFVKTLIRKNFL